ncbi:GNAT family N-acetyltransferase [Neorhizobium sp. JUb45]|uniref:GNAT family N-acetyltransferase n=1 Tax=unclassified Neorhizobium TaxID=2629175 RepID=UPI001049BFFE|nr:GNAT family N-acetyltransferase [Neorhizobium sp. JUb45]
MLPSFETDRLLLRPRKMADFQACLAMDRDPEVTRFVPGPWQNPAEHEVFLRGRIETDHGNGLGYWSIFAKNAPEDFLGWVLLIPRDGVGPEIEIGWRLNRLAWGKGFASEAALTVAAHAFHTLRLDMIVADVMPGNAASLRVAEKLGMLHIGEGHDDNAVFACYAVTRDAFVG